jgi:hypothetical protein
VVELSIVVDTTSLIWLLKLAQRKHTVDGTTHSQLYSLILKAEGGRLSFCSLVKDGVTSLMRLSIPCTGEGEIVVTDIDSTLGVLKYHGGVLYITPNQADSKVLYKSGNKQTTLTASKEAKAFPHTPQTIAQWSEKSQALADKINIDTFEYNTNDGRKLPVKVLLSDLDTTDLYEAFRCDSMNGQKFNRYTLSYEDGKLSVDVGKDLKGKTKTVIDVKSIDEAEPITSTYAGGFEYIFANLSNDVNIGIWNFEEVGMAKPMVIGLGDGDFIFQMSTGA